jgi:hypothetical protein
VRVEEEPAEPELDHLLDRARVLVGPGPWKHRGAKPSMNDGLELPRFSSVGDACTCCPRRALRRK